jgi:hypothetical protein
MAKSAVTAEIHEALDVHRDFASEIPFDLVFPVDHFANAQNFRVRKIVHAAFGGNAGLLADFARGFPPDSVNISQSDFDALLTGDVDSSNPCHRASLVMTDVVLRISPGRVIIGSNAI